MGSPSTGPGTMDRGTRPVRSPSTGTRPRAEHGDQSGALAEQRRTGAAAGWWRAGALAEHGDRGRC
ncbi:MAG TPA: hypothetical protein VN840_00395 [Streptosporangiaceae bacterium]|nr:hypothetical protein [Streptosporangiaceae bacterium]